MYILWCVAHPETETNKLLTLFYHTLKQPRKSRISPVDHPRFRRNNRCPPGACPACRFLPSASQHTGRKTGSGGLTPKGKSWKGSRWVSLRVHHSPLVLHCFWLARLFFHWLYNCNVRGKKNRYGVGTKDTIALMGLVACFSY